MSTPVRFHWNPPPPPPYTSEEADRTKQDNLSYGHIIVCSPAFHQWQFSETTLGEGRVLPHALVLPLEIHGNFPISFWHFQFREFQVSDMYVLSKVKLEVKNTAQGFPLGHTFSGHRIHNSTARRQSPISWINKQTDHHVYNYDYWLILPSLTFL